MRRFKLLVQPIAAKSKVERIAMRKFLARIRRANARDRWEEETGRLEDALHAERLAAAAAFEWPV